MGSAHLVASALVGRGLDSSRCDTEVAGLALEPKVEVLREVEDHVSERHRQYRIPENT